MLKSKLKLPDSPLSHCLFTSDLTTLTERAYNRKSGRDARKEGVEREEGGEENENRGVVA